MNRFISPVLAVLVLRAIPVFAQTENDVALLRGDIAFYADAMVNAMEPVHRGRARTAMEAKLETLLAMPDSYTISLDSIRGVSLLHADTFRIATWQHMVSDSVFEYGGFIQTPKRLTWLRDSRPFLKGSAWSTYTPDAWYGCLYYDIIPFRRDGETLYVLLGFHGQDKLVNTKVADVLAWRDGRASLGVPVFTGQDRPMARLMLTYADVSTVHIRYDQKLRAIVHEHLVNLPGVGPEGQALPVSDGSLEGWVLKKGNWEYVEEMYDVKVKEPPMLEDRKDRKEDRDILGRPKQN
jgi:hypothetical protein